MTTERRSSSIRLFSALLSQHDAEYYTGRAAHHRDRLRTARAFIREDGGTPPLLAAQLNDLATENPETEENDL
ncbi:hypothetical protein [Streptomyces sp. AA1529]|uniref:hypothetical protein n=1 Tax=Streptomyces sp. AA1529 TaxID=1203257 RepID=UPI003D73F48B